MRTANRLLAAAILGASLAPAAALAQAVIAWSASTTIVGDTDVDSSGTLVWAYNFTTADTPLTVNGVTFAAASANNADLTFSNTSALEVHGTVFGNSSAFFTSLSTDYQALLRSSIYFVQTTTSLTFNNLTIGATYRIQLWSNDSRSNSEVLGRTTTVADTLGNTTSIAQNLSSIGGSLGQHVTGTFTATSATQQVNINHAPGGGAIILNAATLQTTSPVPEPAAAAALAGAFSLGLVAFRRRHRVA